MRSAAGVFDRSSNGNLFLCELSHTDAERRPADERPKRLSELSEELSASSPRPHYGFWGGEEAKRESARTLHSFSHSFV